MKVFQILAALLFLPFAITSCTPSLNKNITTKGDFSYGRIKIYKIYDERKMRLISRECHFVNEAGIIDSGLRDKTKYYNSVYSSQYIGKGLAYIPKEKIDYILDQGLFALKKAPKSELVFNQIRCEEKGSPKINKEISIIRLPKLSLEKSEESGIAYFGDLDIFLSKNPSDTKKFRVTQTNSGGAVRVFAYDVITNYYDPVKIVISNNQKQTLDKLEQTLGPVYSGKNQDHYHPMKITDIKSNVKQNIPESDKTLPF